MKIKETISNDLDLDKCYPGHNHEQHSRGFIGWISWGMLTPVIL